MARLLHRAEELAPTPVALRAADTTLTWSELDDRVNRWVHLLRASGLTPGDRILVLAGNRPEVFELLLAALHAGLTLTPANSQLTGQEVAYLLRDSGSRFLVADPDRAPVAVEALESVDRPLLARFVLGPNPVAGLPAAEPTLAEQPAGDPDDQRSGTLLLYTSGTSGRPKGVDNGLTRLGAPLERVVELIERLGAAGAVASTGRCLLLGPWYHSAQLFFTLFPLLNGVPVSLQARFDPATALGVIDAEEITQTHLVPTQMIRLLRVDPAIRAGFRGGSLERVWHGGGPCPPEVKRALIDWWGPVLTEYYAATEGGLATVIDAADWLANPGSVGRAVPGTELVVLDAAGRPVPAGTPGRVFVRRPGARTTFTYRNAPGKTDAAHADPCTFTYGDAGYLDAQGYLYLTGRADETIVSGGVNIYPAEVAGVLQTHPAVRDAAVFGVPDPDFGQRVKAVVAPEDSAAREGELVADLDRHCRRTLAGFKVPRIYQVVPALPRDSSGKLRASALASEDAR
jgi:long-chain acyl-CoA synthetase